MPDNVLHLSAGLCHLHNVIYTVKFSNIQSGVENWIAFILPGPAKRKLILGGMSQTLSLFAIHLTLPCCYCSLAQSNHKCNGYLQCRATGVKWGQAVFMEATQTTADKVMCQYGQQRWVLLGHVYISFIWELHKFTLRLLTTTMSLLGRKRLRYQTGVGHTWVNK